MARPAILLLGALVLGCSGSHRAGSDAGSPGVDAGPPGVDAGPGTVVPPPPGGCTDTPAAMSCIAACRDACDVLEGCGVPHGECIDACYRGLACPGESPGHDEAICSGFSPGDTCESACRFARDWGGPGTSHGIECPPPPVTGCASQGFCGCHMGCEPLVDLTTGCVCPCDDPFNCTGELCDCDCGGATFLGCAPEGQCEMTEIHCGDCAAVMIDGCPACECE